MAAAGSRSKRTKGSKRECSTSSASSRHEPLAQPLATLKHFRVLPLLVPGVRSFRCAAASPPTGSTTTVTPMRLEGAGSKHAAPPCLTHYVYFCEHTTRKVDAALPQGRTLFLLNLPVDTTREHLEAVFAECGAVERFLPAEGRGDRCEDDATPNATGGILTSGARGYLVFEGAEAVDRALGMQGGMDRYWPADPGSATCFGLRRWVQHAEAACPPFDVLQRQVDAHLADFEAAESAAQAAVQEAHNLPDADGFITVTRGGSRRNVHRDQDATVIAANPEEVKALKRKSYNKVDFYRFQMRESKRQQLAELRRKFEQDKERIAALKADRKFRPY